MGIKNTQALLSEQLGQLGGVEIFTTAAQTSKDYYAIYFVQESVIAAITMTEDIILDVIGATLVFNIRCKRSSRKKRVTLKTRAKRRRVKIETKLASPGSPANPLTDNST